MIIFSYFNIIVYVSNVSMYKTNLNIDCVTVLAHVTWESMA